VSQFHPSQGVPGDCRPSSNKHTSLFIGVIQYSVIVSHFDPTLIFVNTALTFTFRDTLDCVAGRDKHDSLQPEDFN